MIENYVKKNKKEIIITIILISVMISIFALQSIRMESPGYTYEDTEIINEEPVKQYALNLTNHKNGGEFLIPFVEVLAIMTISIIILILVKLLVGVMQ